MTGIAGGLATALAWGVAAIFAAYASRGVGPLVTFAYSNLIAFALVLVVALASSGLPSAPASDWAWAALVGLGITAAFPLTFTALTLGRIGVVSAVIATDGAIAAVVAILTGEELAAAAGAGIAMVAGGVLLSVLQPAPGSSAGPSRDRLAVVLALGAAVCFAATLVGASRADGIEPAWVVTTGRGIGVLLATLPILAIRRPRLPRAALPLVTANATCDVAGFLVFVTVARDGLAVPAVLSSQYALVPLLYGVIVFRERLTPLQWIGVALTLAGVATVAAVSA